MSSKQRHQIKLFVKTTESHMSGLMDHILINGSAKLDLTDTMSIQRAIDRVFDTTVLRRDKSVDDARAQLPQL